MPAMAESLLQWYDNNARDLPWRSAPSPYHTLVSEIMLQQTQVETVLPYFERFIQRFPDLPSLAAASQAEVLQTWEGLGYYSRARNLHKTAQILCRENGCELPADPKALQALPGIGRYTAGAIASIAFDLPAPALDANVRRVYARLLVLELPLGIPESEQILWNFARENLPQTRAGDFNQALMEVGALVCKPKNPQCPVCPLQGHCQAFALGKQEEIPMRRKKPAIPHYTVTAAVIWKGKQVLIAQRPQGGLLGGLWEFPGGKLEPDDLDLIACLEREIQEELGVEVQVRETFGIYRHAYTHFRITLHAFQCTLKPGQILDETNHPNIRWVSPTRLNHYAMGKVDRQIAEKTASEFYSQTIV